MTSLSNPPVRRGLGNTSSPSRSGGEAASPAAGGSRAGRPLTEKDLHVILREQYGLKIVKPKVVIDSRPMAVAPVEPVILGEEPVDAENGSTGTRNR